MGYPFLLAEGIVFLFTDSQITNGEKMKCLHPVMMTLNCKFSYILCAERFLVYLNDLLSSGNVPDLYSADEVDEVIAAMTPKVKALGLVPDRDVCWKAFISNVRKNLHVVLCFSPVGDAMRTRVKRAPALVNSTVIDWFQVSAQLVDPDPARPRHG